MRSIAGQVFVENSFAESVVQLDEIRRFDGSEFAIQSRVVETERFAIRIGQNASRATKFGTSITNGKLYIIKSSFISMSLMPVLTAEDPA